MFVQDSKMVGLLRGGDDLQQAISDAETMLEREGEIDRSRSRRRRSSHGVDAGDRINTPLFRRTLLAAADPCCESAFHWREEHPVDSGSKNEEGRERKRVDASRLNDPPLATLVGRSRGHRGLGIPSLQIGLAVALH